MKKKYYLLLLAVFLFYPHMARAQNVTLSISPPTIQTVIKPGKSILIAYTVQNNGDPTTVRSFVLPFEAEGSNGRIVIKDRFDGPIRFSLDNDNIELNKPIFMKSHESKQFLLKIYVPEATPKGDYYYSFLVQTFPPKSIEGSISTQSRITIGSTILMTVSDDGLTQIKGSIKQFNISPLFTIKAFNRVFRVTESTSPLPIFLTVANEGNNYTVMGGTIGVTGMFGERLSYDLIPLTILRGSERTAKTNQENIPECSTQNPRSYCSTVSMILQGFFIGRYQINASVYLNDQTQLMYASTDFYAVPFKMIIGLIISLVIVWIIFKRMKGKKQILDDE